MMRYAAAHDLVCVLPYAVGDFVNRGDVLFEVNGRAPQDAARRLLGMVALGHERTIEQDPAFAVRIIVDIAIRALSPAVNDPTTATQMINHLGTLLAGVGARDLRGRGMLRDSCGARPLAVPPGPGRATSSSASPRSGEYGAARPGVPPLPAMLVDLPKPP